MTGRQALARAAVTDPCELAWFDAVRALARLLIDQARELAWRPEVGA